MKIGFFGTCANDHQLLIGAIETICNQSHKPYEIIIIDSGKKNKEKLFRELIELKNINLVYIFKNLSRVKALNLAIRKSSSDYLLRFDSRTRFSKDYAKNAGDLLKNSNKYFIGGVPSVIPEEKTFWGYVCSGIMSRPYIFLYPRHRRLNYVGDASSVYLGCFESKVLKSIMYRDELNLISEDSIISSDFKKKGFQPFISNNLNLKYVSRSSIINLIKLFNTYGYCRSNSILLSNSVHSLKRYLIMLLFFLGFIFLFIRTSFLSIIISLFIIFLINCLGECLDKGNKKDIIYPFWATFLQLTWFIGFLTGLTNIFLKKNQHSNFIK